MSGKCGFNCTAAICGLEKGLNFRMVKSESTSESLISKSESESAKIGESIYQCEYGLEYYMSGHTPYSGLR